MMNNERCSECRYWSRIAATNTATDFGECRRRPPRVLDSGESRFPETWHDIWCGKWKPKTPPPPEPLDIATELPEFGPPWEEWTKAKPFKIGNRVLSARATRCLARAGIFTVDELLRYPGSVLLKIRNFGITSLLEVEEALQEIGKELPILP